MHQHKEYKNKNNNNNNKKLIKSPNELEFNY